MESGSWGHLGARPLYPPPASALAHPVAAPFDNVTSQELPALGDPSSSCDSESKDCIGLATGRAIMMMSTPVGLPGGQGTPGVPGPTPRRRATVTTSDLPSLGHVPSGSTPLPCDGLVFAFPCSPREAGVGPGVPLAGSLRASPQLPDGAALSRPLPFVGGDGAPSAGPGGSAFTKALPQLPGLATGRPLVGGSGPGQGGPSLPGGVTNAVMMGPTAGMGSPMTLG